MSRELKKERDQRSATIQMAKTIYHLDESLDICQLDSANKTDELQESHRQTDKANQRGHELDSQLSHASSVKLELEAKVKQGNDWRTEMQRKIVTLEDQVDNPPECPECKKDGIANNKVDKFLTVIVKISRLVNIDNIESQEEIDRLCKEVLS